jgi:8-oxo-dGTP pyrophosphatase MutT (NUDIX family)
LQAFAVALNGYVRRPEGIWVWLATRSAEKSLDPGKLDTLVAGGQPTRISAKENLLKEAAEEAGISARTAERAVSVGCVGYCQRQGNQIHRETLFVYDLELPEDFKPLNTDSEVAYFDLLPIGEVAEIVRSKKRFSLGCDLVMIDFLIRRGWLTPEDKDYVAISNGLRGNL